MDEWIEKMYIYTHTEIISLKKILSFSLKKKKGNPVLHNIINLEGIMLSKIRDKYHLISLMCRFKTKTNPSHPSKLSL